MIRSLVLLASLSLVGLTAWTTAPGAPAPSMRLDSAHWASLINSFTDPTLGMVSRDSARGDSLIRHPGAVGWGAEALTCQDALRAGTGSIKVWKVTDTASVTTPGSMRAVWDSLNANDNASTCQYVIFPTGGNYRFNETGNPSYNGMQNWRVLGQTAQGSGANWRSGDPYRVRNVHNYGYEYLNLYRPDEGVSPFDGSARAMNTQKSYLRHISIAFGGRDGDVAVAYGGGTEVVPQVNDTSMKHTVESMMIGELNSIRPLSMIFNQPEEFDRKQRQLTVRRNYMHGSGWRQPAISSSTQAQYIQNVSYNATNRSGEFGKEGGWDLIDFMDRPGPMTPAGGTVGSNRRWPLLILSGAATEVARRAHSSLAIWTSLGGSESDWNAMQPVTPDTATYYLSGIRGWQNGYAVGLDSTDLLRGPGRVVACDSGFEWFHPAHKTGATYCQVDGDSIPINAVNDSATAMMAR